MSINELKTIIQTKNKTSEPEIIFNPQEEIEDYIKLTNMLYEMVRSAIKELVDEELVKLKEEEILINEDELGDYHINTLSILFSNEKVILKPMGTMLIGSKGRVDMIGPKGIERFTLIRKGINSPAQLIKVNFSGVGSGNDNLEKKDEDKKKLTIDDWNWRLLPSDRNWTKFADVTESSITNSLMRVING